MTFSQLISFAVSQGVDEEVLFGLASPPPPVPETDTSANSSDNEAEEPAKQSGPGTTVLIGGTVGGIAAGMHPLYIIVGQSR